MNRGQRRTLVGTVVGDKMDKTVLVRVERLVRDRSFKKYVRRYSRFMAHDEENNCSIGDLSGGWGCIRPKDMAIVAKRSGSQT